jgi:hypothetical protein
VQTLLEGKHIAMEFCSSALTPKSVTFTSPRALISRLLGLRSRCTRLSCLRYARPQRIWKAIFASTRSGMGPTCASTLAKLPPSIYSNAIVIEPSR